MKLFSILIRHCAPKDCKESIVGYLIAKDDLAILEYVNKELTGGCWQDRHEQDGMRKIRDDDGNVIGTETYNERMLRVRGEFNDPDADYSDAYYGITHYGWSEGKEITIELAEQLIEVGIATRI